MIQENKIYSIMFTLPRTKKGTKNYVYSVINFDSSYYNNMAGGLNVKRATRSPIVIDQLLKWRKNDRIYGSIVDYKEQFHKRYLYYILIFLKWLLKILPNNICLYLFNFVIYNGVEFFCNYKNKFSLFFLCLRYKNKKKVFSKLYGVNELIYICFFILQFNLLLVNNTIKNITNKDV